MRQISPRLRQPDWAAWCGGSVGRGLGLEVVELQGGGVCAARFAGRWPSGGVMLTEPHPRLLANVLEKLSATLDLVYASLPLPPK